LRTSASEPASLKMPAPGTEARRRVVSCDTIDLQEQILALLRHHRLIPSKKKAPGRTPVMLSSTCHFQPKGADATADLRTTLFELVQP
jgi:hypothetical protein